MRTYVMISQLIVEVLALTFLGYFIGYKIDNDGILRGILATVGCIIGIIIFIGSIIRYDAKGKKRKI